MQKIYSQQDQAANGTTGISSELGQQDTGIRSQVELEEQVANLLATNEALSNKLIHTDGRAHGAAERSAHLEARLEEANEQYQQAAVVIAHLSNEILQLKAQLYDELSARLAE